MLALPAGLVALITAVDSACGLCLTTAIRRHASLYDAGETSADVHRRIAGSFWLAAHPATTADLQPLVRSVHPRGHGVQAGAFIRASFQRKLPSLVVPIIPEQVRDSDLSDRGCVRARGLAVSMVPKVRGHPMPRPSRRFSLPETGFRPETLRNVSGRFATSSKPVHRKGRLGKRTNPIAAMRLRSKERVSS